MNVILILLDFSDGSGSVVPFGGHQCVCETKTDRYDWTSVGISVSVALILTGAVSRAGGKGGGIPGGASSGSLPAAFDPAV